MKSRKMTCVVLTLLAAVTLSAWVAAQGQTTNFRHYKLIDIGPFGGPESYFPETIDFVSASGELNNRGLAVGGSATSTSTTPTSNFLVCGGISGVLPFVFHAFEWQDGVVTDLGALPGRDNCSGALGINANGVIVGNSENGDIDPLVGVNQGRAVLWKNHQITDLGTLGGYESTASGINNRGQVVGTSTNAVSDSFSCFGLGTECRGFLWQDGIMQDLGTLGGPDALAFLVNEHGQVSGLANTNSVPSVNCPLPLTTDPFLWESGRMEDLGSLGGTCGIPMAINNRGQVVGNSNLVGDSIIRPFLWPGPKGEMQDLGTLGGSFGTANAINEAGEVVGYSLDAGDQAVFAFLWRNGELINLGTLDNDPCSTANAINSRGQIVGISATCDFATFRRAFLWENGSMVDLNALIPPRSGMQLTLAETINDRGEITTNGTPIGCGIVEACGHAVLLIPVCADGTEGCADAPLDPAVVAQSRASSGSAPKTMTAEEVATFKERIARMAGPNRGFGPWRQK